MLLLLHNFISSITDNALLIASIALLLHMSEPSWLSPARKIFFVIPYVIFAPFVGAFADSRPKGQVMLVSNILKTGGCILIMYQYFQLDKQATGPIENQIA